MSASGTLKPRNCVSVSAGSLTWLFISRWSRSSASVYGPKPAAWGTMKNDVLLSVPATGATSWSAE